MIKTINTLQYLPLYLQKYRELQLISQKIDPELQVLSDETEIIKDNQFILTADEVGIEKFEALLKIYPTAEDTIEYRRQRVLFYWNDVIPYTYKVLIERLNILCGDTISYTIEPKFNDYELDIQFETQDILSSQAQDVDYILTYMIPANILIKSEISKEYEFSNTMKYGTATVKRLNRTIYTATPRHEIPNTLNTAFFFEKSKQIIIKSNNL